MAYVSESCEREKIINLILKHINENLLMADEVLYTISEEIVKEGNGTDSNVEIPSSLNIEYEAIPVFEEVRTKLLPVVKTDTWLKSIKCHLQKTNAASQSVFYKPLNNISRIDFGFTVAILCDGDEYHYVLNSYLAAWHISSLTLVQIAQANFRKRLIEEGIAWETSGTGIRFIHGLGSLAASVILLPDLIKSLGGQDGDPVACIPAGDLCMIGKSQNVKHICVMSEIALKFANKSSFLSTQPLRLVDTEWKLYEANKTSDEHPFPKSEDEVKILKRALKMQGKI